MALEMCNLRTALAILVNLCLTAVSGYENGKVEKACESMLPEHHSNPNTTVCPYALTVSVNKFSPGDQIKGTANDSMVVIVSSVLNYSLNNVFALLLCMDVFTFY